MLSSGFVGIRPELHIERPARGDDPQVLVKDDQRFSNGVYHRLRERAGVFDFAEFLFKHGDLSLGAQEYNIMQVCAKQASSRGKM